MRNKRLNGLDLMYVHKDIEPNVNEVLPSKTQGGLNYCTNNFFYIHYILLIFIFI